MEINNSLESKRDQSVDILKGFAIFCVVLGHLNPANHIHNFIYSFHMPLFIFLSGITFWFSFERKRLVNEMNYKIILIYIFKRFISLIIPFIIWCEIKGNVIENERNFIINLKSNFNSYWFLPTLFGIILIVIIPFTFRKKSKNIRDFLIDILILLISEIFSLILFKITGIKIFRQILIYLIPFYFGLCIKKYELFEKVIVSHYLIGFSIVAYLFILPLYNVQDSSILSLSSRFFSGLFFIVIIYSYVVFNKINNNLSKILIAFGKSSLSIYLIQEFFRNTVCAQLYGNCIWLDTIIRVVITLCICFIGVLLNRICDMTIIINLILFGKIKKEKKFVSFNNNASA